MTGKSYLQKKSYAEALKTTYNHTEIKYGTTCALVATRVIEHFNEVHRQAKDSGSSFLETYSLTKGLKKFGEKGKQAAMKEMQQLHDRVCFEPIKLENLTPTEKKRALESLIFLVEKKSGEVKARTCANGSVQRNWMTKEDSTSPTVSIPPLFSTAAIEAYKGMDVATCDKPNAFIQTEQPEFDKDGQKYIMKIRGKLAELLVEIDPETYGPFVIQEEGRKILYLSLIHI